jgi:hypothetical protein
MLLTVASYAASATVIHTGRCVFVPSASVTT